MPPRRFGYKDLTGLLKKKSLPRFWALLGPEEDLKNEARERIVDAISSQHKDGFERVSADAAENGLDAIAVGYLVGSLFSHTKLVEIRGIDTQPAAARKSFLAGLDPDHLHPSIHIVMVTNERETSIPDCFTKITFWPMRTREEMSHWIRETCQRIELKIGGGVEELILEQHGYESGAVRQELVKAKLYVGDKVLSQEDFTAHSTATSQSDVFQVLSDVLAGKTERSIRGLNRLWDQNEPPIKILSMLLSQMRKIMTIAALRQSIQGDLDPALDAALSHQRTQNFWQQKDIEKGIVGLVKRCVNAETYSKYFADLKPLALISTLKAARPYDAEKARKAYQHLIDLDLELKTSTSEPEFGLEHAALKIGKILSS